MYTGFGTEFDFDLDGEYVDLIDPHSEAQIGTLYSIAGTFTAIDGKVDGIVVHANQGGQWLPVTYGARTEQMLYHSLRPAIERIYADEIESTIEPVEADTPPIRINASVG